MTDRKRILIADDVLGVRESLRMTLTDAGFDVVAVDNGRSALETLAAGRFDVLVTDIWMPEIDGLELLKTLRGRQPALRVLAMTGGGAKITLETAASLAEVWGAERVFIKPFDEADLVAAIARAP